MTDDITPPRQRFGRQVRAARLAAGLTLRDLADQTGIPWTTLSKLENGHAGGYVAADKLDTIATALDLDPHEGHALNARIPDDMRAWLAEPANYKAVRRLMAQPPLDDGPNGDAFGLPNAPRPEKR